MKHEALCKAIKQIAWGYLLIHLDFRIGTLNLLPAWAGYLLILHTLPVIGQPEPSALLLKPLGILLAIWEGILWGLSLFGISSLGYLPEIIAAVISLYFHFQLLTNIAGVAGSFGCPQEKSILNLRTVRTIMVTLFALPFPWNEHVALIVIVTIFSLIIVFWLCFVLFSLHRSLRESEPEE